MLAGSFLAWQPHCGQSRAPLPGRVSGLSFFLTVPECSPEYRFRDCNLGQASRGQLGTTADTRSPPTPCDAPRAGRAFPSALHPLEGREGQVVPGGAGRAGEQPANPGMGGHGESPPRARWSAIHWEATTQARRPSAGVLSGRCGGCLAAFRLTGRACCRGNRAAFMAAC